MSSAESKSDGKGGAGLEMLSPGAHFARYEIVRCVGVGGMGAVFEATHSLLKKRVALKTMHSNLIRSEASRARFLREAETVARIRHPNVVDVTDVGIENGVPFLVMEFLEGEDLLHRLQREGQLEPRAAVDAVLPVAAGLCAVHRLGIVHRDVKPENILLAHGVGGTITPKLIDFGVSKDLDASVRAGGLVPHTVTGTPHYMSPEQARGAAQLDGRTDQYALGVLLYQCLTGKLPYESPSLLELIHLIDAGDYRHLDQVRPDLPAALVAAVHRAMARHPRDRFASMESFGQALLPFASERVALMHERDFIVGALPNSVTLDASGPLPAQMAATTPMGDPFGRDAVPARVQTSSGVRVRDESPAASVATHVDPSRKLTWLVGAFVVLALAFAGLTLLLFQRRDQELHAGSAREPAHSYRLNLTVLPESASIELDGVLVGRGKVDRELPRDGREHFLRISAEGFEPRSIVFHDRAPQQAFVELTPIAVPLPVPSLEPRSLERTPPAEPRKKSKGVSEPKPEPAPLDIQLSR